MDFKSRICTYRYKYKTQNRKSSEEQHCRQKLKRCLPHNHQSVDFTLQDWSSMSLQHCLHILPAACSECHLRCNYVTNDACAVWVSFVYLQQSCGCSAVKIRLPLCILTYIARCARSIHSRCPDADRILYVWSLQNAAAVQGTDCRSCSTHCNLRPNVWCCGSPLQCRPESNQGLSRTSARCAGTCARQAAFFINNSNYKLLSKANFCTWLKSQVVHAFIHWIYKGRWAQPWSWPAVCNKTYNS